MHRSQNGIGYTFDAKDRSVHGMIDLIQTPAGTIAGIMENAAHVFDLGSPRVNDGGSVAKFLRSDSDGCRVVNCQIRLGGEPEQPGDEESLADRISFCQPSHSAFANHVHRFNSL